MNDGKGGMHNLEQASVEKDLGVKIDNQLKFSEHVQAKVNTANKTLGFIRHSFQYLDKESFTLLYKCLGPSETAFRICLLCVVPKTQIQQR